jgi:hypothetical protein
VFSILNRNFRLEVNTLPALAFVPTASVPSVFRLLHNLVFIDHLLPLLAYFEKTYVGTAGNEARYPPLIWNLNSRILELEHRTSNALESWHRQLSTTVQASHPTIFKFLEELKLEITLSEQKIDRFSATNKASRRNNSAIKRDVDYKNLVLRFGTMDNFDYLKCVAHSIRLDKKANSDNSQDV